MYRFSPKFEGILPWGPYLPSISMAGRAVLAGYHQIMTDMGVTNTISSFYEIFPFPQNETFFTYHVSLVWESTFLEHFPQNRHLLYVPYKITLAKTNFLLAPKFIHTSEQACLKFPSLISLILHKRHHTFSDTCQIWTNIKCSQIKIGKKLSNFSRSNLQYVTIGMIAEDRYLTSHSNSNSNSNSLN